MKSFFISIFSLALLAGCVSDEDLVQADPNVPTEGSFWKSAEDALFGINATYSKLTFDGTYMRCTPLLLDLRGDGTYSNSPWGAMAVCGKFNNSLSDPAIYGWAYEVYYQGVYRANQVLDNVPSMEIDAAFKDRIIGQAHFLRGLYYFHLVNMFNAVSLPTTAKEGIYHPQKTHEEGWDQIISDFKIASEKLPWDYSGVSGLDSGDIGRATKGSALGYLGKSYLFRANENNNDETLMNLALDAFNTIITSNKYALVANYRDNFTDSNEFNSESLFEVSFNRDVNGADICWFDGMDGAGCGRTSARAITYAARGFGWTDVQPTVAVFNDFNIEATVDGNVDPRLDATILYNRSGGFPMYGTDFAVHYADSPDINQLFVRKYENDETMPNEFDWRSGINERILRYADVLLMAAEVHNELGNSAKAYEFIQTVRDRVNLPDLSTTKPGMTKAQMRDQIAHERNLEFLLEGKRFDDIRRWGWLKDPDKLAWLKSRDPEFNTYVSGREYYPIPQAEIDRNPGTVQNPGW